jgi:ribosomal protein S18 acetylase RimI-like enzyme
MSFQSAEIDAHHGLTVARAVRVATAADASALTRVLVDAFADDPFISWAVRTDERRTAAYWRLFDLFVRRLSLPYGHVFTTDRLDAVALWVPPGCWRQGAVDQVRQLPDWMAIVGLKRMSHVHGAIATLLSKHPNEPHYYLPFVGVDRSARGQGTGSAVLQPVLQWCDTLQLGAYLENTNERNLVFYDRLGFGVLEMMVLAEHGPTVWRMWRAPAGSTV